MPELPEVETVRRGLEKVLLGTTLQHVDILCERCFEGEPGDIKDVMSLAPTEEVRKRIWNRHYHNRDHYWESKHDYDKRIA